MMSKEGNINILSERDFDDLFRRCRPVFIKIANSYIHDIAVAEDITDECFIRLWEKRDSVFTVSYESYVFRSVVNSCLNHLKSLQTRARIHNEMHESGNRMLSYEINSLSKCNPERLMETEVRKLIQECLDRMPSITRQTFVASRYEDLTYQEISLKMGISVRQVTTHMQLALKLMREALKDYIPILLLLAMLSTSTQQNLWKELLRKSSPSENLQHSIHDDDSPAD